MVQVIPAQNITLAYLKENHVIANETKWSEAIAKYPTNNKPMRLLRRSSSQ